MSKSELKDDLSKIGLWAVDTAAIVLAIFAVLTVIVCGCYLLGSLGLMLVRGAL